MSGRVRKSGEFCWVNMLTPEAENARAFFSGLLGWTYEELPQNMGHVILASGRKVGGLFTLSDPAHGSPAIGVMVRVDSTDEISARVSALGGRVAKGPFDVMQNGRMSVCFDPTGGGFDPWQPKSQPLDEVDDRAPGAPCWFELLTDDVSKAAAFYCALFGWTTERRPMPDFEYTICRNGEEMVAGIMPILGHMGDVKPHWATYFAVTDVELAEIKARELGGKVIVPVMPVPDVGRLCGIESPQGVRFYVMQYDS